MALGPLSSDGRFLQMNFDFITGSVFVWIALSARALAPLFTEAQGAQRALPGVTQTYSQCGYRDQNPRSAFVLNTEAHLLF